MPVDKNGEWVFAKEADLVTAYCGEVARLNSRVDLTRPRWTFYHETAGWDLLLVDNDTGIQVGIEAKLTLTAKAIEQALPSYYTSFDGPDYRAVLIPKGKAQQHLKMILHYLGITLIEVSSYMGFKNEKPSFNVHPDLPNENSDYGKVWTPWLPEKRCALPDYIPDVSGGHSAPVMLTQWKVAAIKLMILLEKFGGVTRKDMRLLNISPTRWTAPRYGYLSSNGGVWVRNERTPDLRKQHPVNYVEIEADYPNWGPAVREPG